MKKRRICISIRDRCVSHQEKKLANALHDIPHSANNLHFVSEALQNIVIDQYGEAYGAGLVLPMVFGLEDFRQPNLTAAKETKRILFVGRLMEVKGVDVLINAFSQLMADVNFNEWTLTLLERGSGRRTDRPGPKRNEQRIEFHGSKHRHELVEFYKQAELFVSSKTTSLEKKWGWGSSFSKP